MLPISYGAVPSDSPAVRMADNRGSGYVPLAICYRGESPEFCATPSGLSSSPFSTWIKPFVQHLYKR